MRADITAVLVAWSAGGWFFLWVTTRCREVGLGYGWLLRGVFLALTVTAGILGVPGGAAASSAAVGRYLAASPIPESAVWAFACAGSGAAVVSVLRRQAGVAGQRASAERRLSRVAAMTGVRRPPRRRSDTSAAEFPPVLDFAAASAGLLAAVLLGVATADGSIVLPAARMLVGALFLGAVTDAMLLGHWYLVQPGLPRAPLLQLVRIAGVLWLPETIVMLLPVGMASVLTGDIDDGYKGLLGWFWVACTATTAVLVAVALMVLRERQYAAVMAATGLMYLAIVTAFGQDLVPRVLLAG